MKQSSLYSYRHQQVRKLFGKPDVCDKCGEAQLMGRQIHWADIIGKVYLIAHCLTCGACQTQYVAKK